MKRSARRQIETALIRELIVANVASATLDPWVGSFDLVPGSRVRAIAAVMPDSMDSDSESVGTPSVIWVCSMAVSALPGPTVAARTR